MGTDCWNKILNFHLSISLMRHNSHRSIQPSPSEQIALPIRGLNQPYTLPLWREDFGSQKEGEQGDRKGKSCCRVFSASAFRVGFFPPKAGCSLD